MGKQSNRITTASGRSCTVRKSVSFTHADIAFIEEQADGLGLSFYLRLLIRDERRRQAVEEARGRAAEAQRHTEPPAQQTVPEPPPPAPRLAPVVDAVAAPPPGQPDPLVKIDPRHRRTSAH